MLGRLSASGCLSGLLLVRDGGARIVVRAGPPGGKVVVAVEPSRMGKVVREGSGKGIRDGSRFRRTISTTIPRSRPTVWYDCDPSGTSPGITNWPGNRQPKLPLLNPAVCRAITAQHRAPESGYTRVKPGLCTVHPAVVVLDCQAVLMNH